MKRLILFILTLILLITLFGCAKTVSGTFVNEKNSKQYLELKSDGTLYLEESGGHTGKYTVDGNTITLDFGGPAARGTINGDTITDDEGKKWIKK